MPDTTQALQTLQQQSFETSVRDQPQSGTSLFSMLIAAGDLIPPWWSPKRDAELRRFVPKSDHLLGMIYAMISKVCTIPFEVTARDQTIDRHVEQAIERTDCLVNASEYFKGWNVLMARFLLDHYTQDNGSFMQIIGGGRPDQPLIGWPFGLVQMDASRIQRTRNPEFPVLFRNDHGDLYKVHFTRVIEMSSLPSANLKMNGVGTSAVSRCINSAQNLIDIATYKQEKLGSRPLRALIAGSNISTEQMEAAVRMAGDRSTQQGLTRFAKAVFVGNDQAQVDLKIVDLASLPDGFNEDSATKLGMSIGALAFGVDYREFMPATITGATKADAEVQAQKAKQKWAEVLQRLERLINQKFLPPQLQFRFDWHDEEDNQLRATVELSRAQAAKENLLNGSLTERVVREKWLNEGILSRAQFEQMELDSGRLEDGEDVLFLFQSDDPKVTPLVKLPATNPTLVADNDPTALIKAIDLKLLEVSRININSPREVEKRTTRQAIAALKTLRQQYVDRQAQERQATLDLQNSRREQAPPTQSGPTATGAKTSPPPDRQPNEGGPGATGGNVGSQV